MDNPANSVLPDIPQDLPVPSDGAQQAKLSQETWNISFSKLQDGLQSCIKLVNTEVMKNYITSLQDYEIVPIDDDVIKKLNPVHFFRITRLVYQNDEFSIHKLATVFHSLSHKPCTLVLLIHSNGDKNDFYLGVRSRDEHAASGTMRSMLERSLTGMFPGSKTENYLTPEQQQRMENLSIGCVSSATVIPDYKQRKDSVENKNFIQGLEMFINSMRGKPFTAVCIANNLTHDDLVEQREEYERIYTLLSPFAKLQYNYGVNADANISSSYSMHTDVNSNQQENSNVTNGIQADIHETQSDMQSTMEQHTTNTNDTTSDGNVTNTADSQTHTDGTNTSTSVSKSKSTGLSLTPFSRHRSKSKSTTTGTSKSDSTTHSTSNAVSTTLSHSLGQAVSHGKTHGQQTGTSSGFSVNNATSYGTGTSQGVAIGWAQNLSFTNGQGQSQSVMLELNNKKLNNLLERLDKQFERLNECESIGLWDCATYFLGESAAEAEVAASLYHSLMSGEQSGVESSGVNTWSEPEQVHKLVRYIKNFEHPVFRHTFNDDLITRQQLLDATALTSTNELSFHFGLPRQPVKGVQVIERTPFMQEIVSNAKPKPDSKSIFLGYINHLDENTSTPVRLDLQSLTMHTFVTGTTGSGKSNTLYQLLSQLLLNGIKFLVIEPAKGEYKHVFGNRSDVTVYGTTPMLSNMLHINPFSFPRGIHVAEHLGSLIEVFNACWPMYAAMPAVLKDAIHRAYVKAGWDMERSVNRYSDRLFPSFSDVLDQINIVMDESSYSSDSKGDYKGALSKRIESLTTGIDSMIFTTDEIPDEKLFDSNVIVDLSRVGSSETLSLIMGLLVIKLREYRMATSSGMNVPLQHVTVLEEAHNLLMRTSMEQSAEGSNIQGKSVEMLTKAIAELRSDGEGFIIADQSPSKLDPAVIRNTSTKIVMQLTEAQDCDIASRSLSLSNAQSNELTKLSTGVAIVTQRSWLQPVLCSVQEYKVPTNQRYTFHVAPYNALYSNGLSDRLITLLADGNVFNLIDVVGHDIVSADVPASIKCMLFEYVKANKEQRFNLAAAIAYDLLSAKPAYSSLCNTSLDFQQQKCFLLAQLKPSLAWLPAHKSSMLLYLTAYRHISQTHHPIVQTFLHNLLDEQSNSTQKN